jgi:hypothetical protein
MVAELDNDRYFRWFDSGDMYSIGLARKILEVCERTPWVKHWIPTRMYKFQKFALVLARLQALPNVVVRLSSDSITGETVEGQNTSTISTLDTVPSDAVVCEAYTRAGKCDKCRACWDKSVSVVAYIGHGRSMVKRQTDLIATTGA